MKIMIDTNIVISAVLFPNGKAAKAFYKALLPPYEPLLCDYVIDELHRKFREKVPDGDGSISVQCSCLNSNCEDT